MGWTSIWWWMLDSSVTSFLLSSLVRVAVVEGELQVISCSLWSDKGSWSNTVVVVKRCMR